MRVSKYGTRRFDGSWICFPETGIFACEDIVFGEDSLPLRIFGEDPNSITKIAKCIASKSRKSKIRKRCFLLLFRLLFRLFGILVLIGLFGQFSLIRMLGFGIFIGGGLNFRFFLGFWLLFLNYQIFTYYLSWGFDYSLVALGNKVNFGLVYDPSCPPLDGILILYILTLEPTYTCVT